ncbi:MAG: valine--tRNA ligase [Candidatus Bathyarchaeia archaeon]
MSRNPFKPKVEATRWSREQEERLLDLWEKTCIYAFDESSEKPIFSIDTPPPYPSGKWGVAQAAHYAQIDMVARSFRMRGYEVLFPFGIDRNGLPVEVQVEREHGIRIQETSRETFLALCRAFIDKVEADLLRVARALGLSCDLKGYYQTDSPEYRRVTQASFLELWKRNLVYEDQRPTNWCPVCGTAIADAEIEYKELETILVYIKFSVKETGKEILIATTRPELLCSCAVVIFNPKDERYQALEGLTAIVPIYGKEVPIIAHPYAKPEFGTGLVMICSFGDYSDVRLFRELNLHPLVAIGIDGRMLEPAGPYAGLTIEEARRQIIEDLRRRGLIVKEERILHRTPVCWRSKNPIEFVVVREYYLKQLEFLPDLRRLIDTMAFYPPEHKQILINWIDSISTDWPITRRRYYGTEVPVWYCKKCGSPFLPPEGRYYQPWKEPPPNGSCPCGSTEFVGEERTFDTWMDSSISQLFILGYKRNEKLFERAFPCSVRTQGKDIVRTWLYYSILRTYQLLGRAAFRSVWISGMGLDEKGEAMHKSKGNVVDPEPILAKYGADAFRFWAASEAKLGSDYRFSEAKVSTARLFITKLWNVARFISAFPMVKASDEFELLPLDRLILSELNILIEACRLDYDKMDFFGPANAIKSFTWDLLADQYLEAVKSRAYNQEGSFSELQQKGAWYTLHECLSTVLKLLAPICPFVTDALWLEIYGKESIHLQSLPEVREEWKSDLRRLTPDLIAFNAAIWKFKKEMGLSLNSKLDAKVYAPKELEPFNEDLKAMHRIRELLFVAVPENEADRAKKLGEGIFIVG